MKEFFDKMFSEEMQYELDNLLAFASFAMLAAWLFFGPSL